MRSITATLQEENGQSLVEIALVIPVLALLLLGAGEFARLAYDQIEISNAARAGVAYGAQSLATAVDLSGIQWAALHDAADLQGMSTTAAQFCSCSNAPSTTVSCLSAAGSCESQGAHALNYIQVNTSATIDPLIHYPGLPSTFTLTSSATMRVEQ